MSIRGGEASVLTSEPSEALLNLRYNPDGILTGIGVSTALVTFVQTDGTTEVESASSGGLSAEDRFVSISPDGLWFLSNISVSGILQGTLASFDNPQEREILEDDDESPSRLQLDWLSNSRAVAIKKFSNGTYEASILSGLSQAKAGNTSALQLKTLFTSLTPIAEPLAEGSGETFVYECEDTSGASDLCQSDTSGNVTALVDGNVTHIDVPGDDRYVIYEVSSGDGSDSCTHEIQLYNHETAETTDLVTGCHPTPHPQDSDLIVYLALFDETPQVGVINLDNYSLGLPASQLVLTGSASVNAGSCNRYLVNTVDSVGNAANVTATTTVNLSGAGTGAFYSDSNCTQAVTFVTITTGQNSAAFYYKGSSSETVKLAVSASGLAGTTITVSVTFTTPTTLTLGGPTTLQIKDCSSAYTVTTKNAQNETTAVAQNIQITLSGAGNGSFYSDSTCSTTIGNVTITTGNTSSTFYYKNNQAESVTLLASSSSLSTASVNLTVNPVPATKLGLSGKTTITKDECVAYTIIAQDSTGESTPISLTQDTTLLITSNSVMGSYYGDASCTGFAATAASNFQVSLPAGKTSKSIFFSLVGLPPSNNPYTLTVAPVSGSISSASLNITVTNNP